MNSFTSKSIVTLVGIDPGKSNAFTLIAPSVWDATLISRQVEVHEYRCDMLITNLIYCMSRLGLHDLAICIEEPKVFIDEEKNRAQAAAMMNNFARMNRQIGFIEASLERSFKIHKYYVVTQATWKANLKTRIPGVQGNVKAVDYKPRNKKELEKLAQLNFMGTGTATKLPGYRKLIREYLDSGSHQIVDLTFDKSTALPDGVKEIKPLTLNEDACSSYGLVEMCRTLMERSE